MTTRTFVAVTAILFATIAPVPCFAEYTLIQLNLFDAIVDTTFDASTGEFRVFSDDNDALTLHDPAPLPGTITNTVFDLRTNLDVILDEAFPAASFVGGQLALTFDYDNGAGPVSYYIGGPLDPMLIQVTSSGLLSRMLGEGVFATSWDLPGSNNWPSSQGDVQISHIFPQDLTGWNWDDDLEGHASLSLFPRVIPEPGAFVLLVVGAVLFRRRC